MQRVVRHGVGLADDLTLLLGRARLQGEVAQLLGLLLDLVGAQERGTVGDALEDVRLVHQLLLVAATEVVLAAQIQVEIGQMTSLPFPFPFPISVPFPVPVPISFGIWVRIRVWLRLGQLLVAVVALEQGAPCPSSS